MGFFGLFKKKDKGVPKMENVPVSPLRKKTKLGVIKKATYEGTCVVMWEGRPITQFPLILKGYSNQNAETEAQQKLTVSVFEIHKKKQ